MSTQYETQVETYVGIVKSFNNAEGKGGGYGFIGRPGCEDMFVHISELRGALEQRALYAGDQVSFEIGTGRNRKPCAVNVRVQLRAEKSDSRRLPLHRHD